MTVTAEPGRPAPASLQSGPPTGTTRGQGYAAITTAAREVFAERGYHGASIREIAKRAGLSLSTLYYWHASKQELLAALISESRQSYLQSCDEALRDIPADDPAARLCALVATTIEYQVRRGVESTIAARERRNLDQRHVDQLDQLRQAASRLWIDTVNDGVKRSVFGCEHPDDARRAVEAACNATRDWYKPSGSISVDTLVDRYRAIALRIVDHRT